MRTRYRSFGKLALLLTFIVSPLVYAQNRARAIPAVMSTDCGVETDDQWALSHLLLSPEIDLRGVLTSHAHSIGFSSAASARAAAEVIARVVQPRFHRPPVIPGSSAPLKRAQALQQNAAAAFLIQMSRTFSESKPLTVFLTGAGTDVASALLEDRSIAKRISLVAMGFDDWPGGGDVFNIKNDPLAWQVILDSEVPVVVASSAVTRRSLRLTRDEAAALMRPHGPVGEYLFSVFDGFMKKESATVAQYVASDTWVLWDEAVVAYALGMARSKEVPRPKLQADLRFAHPATNRRITWLTEIDTRRFWQDFTRKIDARPTQR